MHDIYLWHPMERELDNISNVIQSYMIPVKSYSIKSLLLETSFAKMLLSPMQWSIFVLTSPSFQKYNEKFSIFVDLLSTR